MSAEGMPGGCNPADALNKLATARGIRPPVFELVGLLTQISPVCCGDGAFFGPGLLKFLRLQQKICVSCNLTKLREH